MPFLLPTQDNDNFLFFVGLCRYARAPSQARYIIISLRGDFTLQEARPFLMHSRARDTVPFYGDYFANSLAVNTMGMSVELPLAEKYEKIKYYIEHSMFPVSFLNMNGISRDTMFTSLLHQRIVPKKSLATTLHQKSADKHFETMTSFK